MGTLKQLADDFGRAADEVIEECRKVVSRGALNVKNEARDLISGRAHLPHYPRSITYETRVLRSEVVAVIGPERSRSQGPLGSILENGSVNNAPIPHLAPAADNEEPRLERAAADLGEKLLDER